MCRYLIRVGSPFRSTDRFSRSVAFLPKRAAMPATLRSITLNTGNNLISRSTVVRINSVGQEADDKSMITGTLILQTSFGKLFW